MASKVVKEATTITVKDETAQIINPEAKKMADETAQIINPEAKKMADEIEAKMKQEMKKARARALTALWFCSFIIVGAIGVIIESVELLEIPESHGSSPLALNHVVVGGFLVGSCVAILFALGFLAIDVKRISNVKRKSLKTILLLNLMRKANQAEEGGVVRSAVEEINQEYGKKQKELKKTRDCVVLLMAYFVMWIGLFAATLGVAERFFHPKDDDVPFVMILLPGCIIPAIIIMPLWIVWYCWSCCAKLDKPTTQRIMNPTSS